MSQETVDITFLGTDLTVIGAYFPGQRGRTSGPPEDCFPEEPSDFEIEDILVNGCSIYEMVQCCAIAQNTQPISHRDFLIELAEAVNRSVPTSAGIIRTEARGGDYQGRVVSRQRAKDVLGWEPTTQFEEGFDQTLQWFLAKWSEKLAAV